MSDQKERPVVGVATVVLKDGKILIERYLSGVVYE